MTGREKTEQTRTSGNFLCFSLEFDIQQYNEQASGGVSKYALNNTESFCYELVLV